MHRLESTEAATLREWFIPDRPGPLVGLHVLQTGHGACLVDRWPRPRAVLAECGANLALLGDHRALTASDLRRSLHGFVDAPAVFEPALRAAYPSAIEWSRVILELPGPPAPVRACAAEIRRLGTDDAAGVQRLSADIDWISETWGSPAGLAASGYAWGAFVDARLVAIACTFFEGATYEDVGVVTEAAFRRRGLSTACAARLCADIQARGRRPSWSTSPDNGESLAVARKLGFVLHRQDRLFIVSR